MSGKAKTLDALTGLRFIAALAVFVHHVSGRFGFVGAKGPLGNLAVSFFFVLSGFILTYVYHNRLKWGGIKKFYFTRCARIWPLHLACLLLMLVFLHDLSLFSTDSQHWGKLFANVFMVQSWVPDKSYVFGFNSVSWSISTEMFFYLMFPLFLLGGQKQFWYKYAGLLLAIAGLVIGATMVSHTNWFPNVNYTRLGHNNPLFRLPEFCTGMAAGFIYLNREKVKATMTAPRPRSFAFDTVIEIVACGSIVAHELVLQKLGVVAYIANAEWGGVFPSSFLQFTNGCFLFAVVIYIFSKSDGLVSRFCSTRAMVFLGEVSFAFYMIHQLVIRLVIEYAKFYGDLSPVIVVTAVGLLSLAASIVLYKIVEMPSKNGLLALYDGKWAQGLSTIPRATLNFSRTGLCALTILLVVGPMTVLDHYKSSATPPASRSAVKEIVSQTDPAFRGIQFDESVVLLGYEVQPKPKGWLFSLVWQKQSEFGHARYVHVCDRDGKVIGRGPRALKKFRDARLGDTFVDSFFLKQDEMAGGSSIGIGFFEKNAMMRVSHGPRSLGNHRLDLIQAEEFSRIAAVHKQDSRKRVSNLGDNGKTILR